MRRGTTRTPLPGPGSSLSTRTATNTSRMCLTCHTRPCPPPSPTAAPCSVTKRSTTLDPEVHRDERSPIRTSQPQDRPVSTSRAAIPSTAPTRDHGPAPSGTPRRSGSLGPVGLLLAGGVSVQFGGALAVTLMPRAGALGVVTLRLLAAAVVLLLFCRPRLRGHSRADWGTVIVFGVTMGAMNGLFYEAVARIPLGAAVTLEVLGPLALSVLAS